MIPAVNNAVGTLFLVMAVGFALKKGGVITRATEESMAALLEKAAIPAFLLYSLLTRFSLSLLKDNYPALLAAFLILLGAVIAGLLLSRLAGIPPASQGIFSVMVAFPNTVLFGIPLIRGVFGEGGIPWLLLFQLMASFLFWTLGIQLIGRDSGARLFSLVSLQNLFRLPVLALLLGIGLLWQGISLPDPVMAAMGWLKDLMLPLSALYLGAVLADSGGARSPGLKATLFILLGRFLLTPLIAWGVLILFGFHGTGVKVMIVSSALPVMAEVAVMAESRGQDRPCAAFLIAVSCLLSLVITPVFLTLF